MRGKNIPGVGCASRQLASQLELYHRRLPVEEDAFGDAMLFHAFTDTCQIATKKPQSFFWPIMRRQADFKFAGLRQVRVCGRCQPCPPHEVLVKYGRAFEARPRRGVDGFYALLQQICRVLRAHPAQKSRR